jgi:NADH-quinone oxidoreductase subunit J
MIAALAFYLFSAIAVLSGVLVITARNPVHSVLWLIVAFFNAAGLFILLGAEFIGMILVIVYVGAVAVLFLFVVMMLDINFSELRGKLGAYTPIGALIGMILLAELVLVLGAWTLSPATPSAVASPTPTDVTNTEALGRILYTDYVYVFQVSGLILLVAMIGAIVLTLRVRAGVRRQNVAAQVSRTVAQSMTVRKVEKGSGI